MTRNFNLIDLSHSVDNGMITYKGLPAPVITDHLSREASKQLYEAGTEFHIGRIEMVANTGTYLDSPFHRYSDGVDLAGLDLFSVANLDGVVIKHEGTQRAIEPDSLAGINVKGKAVLFQTNWDQHWRTDEYWSGRHPFVSESLAQLLVQSGAALVGIDSYNIDNTETGARSAHSILLKNNIPIVEHMCGLRDLPVDGFKFFAVPVKVRKFGTFPVRAFAIV
ncbi:MAG TPA: cyclase family protein [Pyrinomonadaceae bacterium]